MKRNASIIACRSSVKSSRYFYGFLAATLFLLAVHYFHTISMISDVQGKMIEIYRTRRTWHDYLIDSWNRAPSDQELVNLCNYENDIFKQKVHQTDPCLIDTFKKKLLLPPPPTNEKNHNLKMKSSQIPSNIEKLKWVEKLLIENPTDKSDSRWPGFFVECGANDGEYLSSAIRLEKYYNWTGLLVEANPSPFKKLKKLKRNAWAANVAACTTEYPEQLTFYTNPKNLNAGATGMDKNAGLTVNFTVQCIPMYTMLAALKVDTVDYLSLDVEGYELSVLKTIPFDKILFKIITVEYLLVPGKLEALNSFLIPKGYKYVKQINDHITNDCLYVHESLYELATKHKPSFQKM